MCELYGMRVNLNKALQEKKMQKKSFTLIPGY